MFPNIKYVTLTKHEAERMEKGELNNIDSSAIFSSIKQAERDAVFVAKSELVGDLELSTTIVYKLVPVSIHEVRPRKTVKHKTLK